MNAFVMPEFIHNNKLYYHAAEFALDKIGGPWKMPILWRLNKRILSFEMLRKEIPQIPGKILTSQLNQLEQDGMVRSSKSNHDPSQDNYKITEKGKSAIPVIQCLRKYGAELMEMEGLDISAYKN